MSNGAGDPDLRHCWHQHRRQRNSQFGFFALANPINFNNSVVTFNNNATNRIFLTGPITLTGNNQITADANGFGATGFSGVVTGSGSLSLLGGALVMQNPNNTYSGGTNLGSGNLIVTASDTIQRRHRHVVNGPLGSGAVNLTGGLFQAAATNVPDLTVNAITLHNAITLINANTTIGGPGTNAGAGGDITLAGPMTLTGANNTLSVSARLQLHHLRHHQRHRRPDQDQRRFAPAER